MQACCDVARHQIILMQVAVCVIDLENEIMRVDYQALGGSIRVSGFRRKSLCRRIHVYILVCHPPLAISIDPSISLFYKARNLNTLNIIHRSTFPYSYQFPV